MGEGFGGKKKREKKNPDLGASSSKKGRQKKIEGESFSVARKSGR